MLKLHRFYYEKDIHFVCDLFNLHNFNPEGLEEYQPWDVNKVFQFFNSVQAVKKFKQFFSTPIFLKKLNICCPIGKKTSQNGGSIFVHKK